MKLLQIATLAATFGLLTSNIACSKNHNAYGRNLVVGGQGNGKASGKSTGRDRAVDTTCPADLNGTWSISSAANKVDGTIEISTDDSGRKFLQENENGVWRKIDGAPHTESGVTYTAGCADGKLDFEFNDGTSDVKREYSVTSKGDGSLIEAKKDKGQTVFAAPATYRLAKAVSQ